MILTDIEKLSAALIPAELAEPEHAQFYVHVHRQSQKIVAVSPVHEVDQLLMALPVSWKQAHDFMNGEESIDEWTISESALKKLERAPLHVASRLETSQVIELPQVTTPDHDIIIRINRKTDQVTILWSDSARQLQLPVKLYFTGDGDPTVLKCSVALTARDLASLPGQQTYPVSGVDDISILAANNGLKFSVERMNEIQYVRV